MRELATDWLDQRPSPTVVDLLLEATGGNPLVLRSLLERLRDRGGPVDISASSDLLGPTSLDHELWLRVEGVGDECGEMLVHAAILGDGASLERLAAVSGLDGATLDALIDEASEHHVLVADDERYWFDHPQLRQLVYYSTTATERAAGHMQVANRLADLGTDVVVVAHHVTRAGDLVDPTRVLEVCGAAADHSATVGAWRDAITYASAALDAGSRLVLDDREMAALELRVGRAAFLAHDRNIAITHLTIAVDLARSAGALDLWGRAAVRLAREAPDSEMHSSTARSLAALDEFIAAAGDEQQALRAEVHALQAELSSDRDDLAGARRHIAIAESLAAVVDDIEVRTKVAFARGVQHLFSVEMESATECFDVACPLATGLADPNPRVWCLNRLGLVRYATGDLARAESLLAEGRVRGARRRQCR